MELFLLYLKEPQERFLFSHWAYLRIFLIHQSDPLYILESYLSQEEEEYLDEDQKD